MRKKKAPTDLQAEIRRLNRQLWKLEDENKRLSADLKAAQAAQRRAEQDLLELRRDGSTGAVEPTSDPFDRAELEATFSSR